MPVNRTPVQPEQPDLAARIDAQRRALALTYPGRAELTAKLRAWAKGRYAAMASVEILAAHDTLLDHLDGADLIVPGPYLDGSMMTVDWSRLPTELGYLSGGEEVMLNLMWALVDREQHFDLSDLARLDRINTRIALAALALAAGDEDLAASIGCMGPKAGQQ